MKLLIALLCTLSLSVSALAKKSQKVTQYFELGTSFSLGKTKVQGKEDAVNFVLQASKGYIFNNRWDLSLGLRYAESGADKTIKPKSNPKQYAAQVAVKYLFKKRPGLIKHHHHKSWMVPYVGLAYQWRRFSPHIVPTDKKALTGAKTLEPGYLVSAGVRCFMKKNLAMTLDISYRKATRVTTIKASGAELANTKITELRPSLSFVYFY